MMSDSFAWVFVDAAKTRQTKKQGPAPSGMEQTPAGTKTSPLLGSYRIGFTNAAWRPCKVQGIKGLTLTRQSAKIVKAVYLALPQNYNTVLVVDAAGGLPGLLLAVAQGECMG